MDKKIKKIIENHNLIIKSTKWFKILFLNILFLSVLFSIYYFFKKNIANESNVIALVTFVGGLFGALVVTRSIELYKTPIIKINTWEDSSVCLWNSGDHVHYKIKATNQSPFMAKKCQIKISLLYNEKDIEGYNPYEEKNPTKMHIDDKSPFIRNQKEYSEVTNEHILWDFRPHGTQELEIDIPPQSSYLATIARYHLNKSFHSSQESEDNKILFDYFKILSEDPNTPRVYLNHKNKYKIEIKIFGENFMPIIKDVILKNP
ncbi:MAG: hypothetical protein KAJ14_10570 [Candidatus Omnitrophica bacterium]|nr:hypothetical protein [Candidatus Omnitrophota bacterium]MCK5590545.1 hypothetical protein [Candidatus Paceibacterota bacterium]